MEKLPQMCLLLLVGLALCSTSNGASILNKRAVAESEAPKTKICQNNSPCGWGIYTPFTRQVDYFMKNTCVCEQNQQCLRTDDDLSVSAYVYRCRDYPESKKLNNSS